MASQCTSDASGMAEATISCKGQQGISLVQMLSSWWTLPSRSFVCSFRSAAPLQIDKYLVNCLQLFWQAPAQVTNLQGWHRFMTSSFHLYFEGFSLTISNSPIPSGPNRPALPVIYVLPTHQALMPRHNAVLSYFMRDLRDAKLT